MPNYAVSTEGDFIEGDDLVARNAAVDALGRLNGSVVVADADSGRILTIVNQKLAYKSGYQPCSTIKVPVALAALSETVIDRLTKIRIYGNTKVAMTEALAKSNNYYFASLGEKLGFERMSYYARLFGLGEKASLDIDEEQPGILPAETPKSGMGMMTSFGDGITITPLEMAGLMGAVANGGTLYYLQYPKSQEQAGMIIPQVKRRLDIDYLIPGNQAGHDGGRGIWNGSPHRVRSQRTHLRQDRHVHRHAHADAPGLVRIVYRSGRPAPGRGGAADRRKRGERSYGRGRRRQRV